MFTGKNTKHHQTCVRQMDLEEEGKSLETHQLHLFDTRLVVLCVYACEYSLFLSIMECFTIIY